MFLCVYVSMGIHMLLRMCGIQNNLEESVFSFYHVEPRLAGERLDTLSHLDEYCRFLLLIFCMGCR